jgi:hypothetical protein
MTDAGKIAELTEALRDVLGLIDTGYLVRDTSKDGEPGWAIKQLEPVRRLANARSLVSAALAPPEPEIVEEYALPPGLSVPNPHAPKAPAPQRCDLCGLLREQHNPAAFCAHDFRSSDPAPAPQSAGAGGAEPEDDDTPVPLIVARITVAVRDFIAEMDMEGFSEEPEDISALAGVIERALNAQPAAGGVTDRTKLLAYLRDEVLQLTNQAEADDARPNWLGQKILSLLTASGTPNQHRARGAGEGR